MSKISELSDGGSLVSSDYLIAVRSGGNVKVRMDQINVDQIDLGDNEFIRLGNSQDLTIVHDASNSIINQAGIGDLLIQKAGTTKASFTTNGLEFPDSSKAIFGAGSALSIYHSGSHSFISEAGTGDLYIGASNNIALMNAAFSENKLLATTDGALTLYHNGSAKLATTATGVDVTGTVTADGANIDGAVTTGDLTIDNDDTPTLNFKKAASADILGTINVTTDAGSGGKMVFQTKRNGDTALDRMTIDDGGNVGIGASSPVSFGANTAGLTVNGSSGSHITWQNNGTNVAFAYNAGNNFIIGSEQADSDTIFIAGGSEAMRIDGAAGNVSVGTTSSFAPLYVKETGWSSGSPYGTVAYILGGDVNDANWGHLLVSQSGTTTGSGGKISFGANGDNPIAGIKAYYAGATYGHLDFYTRPSGGTSTQRMRIDSSGDVSLADDNELFFNASSSSQETRLGWKYGGTLQSWIEREHSDGSLVFGNQGSERMRIDSSGNLLVGKTANNITDTGVVVRSTGETFATRSGAEPLSLNRLSTDGDVLTIRKDSAVVGSIGTLSSKIYVGSDDTSLFFDSLRDALVPHNGSTNAARDAAIDLGRDVVRFKDLYLSGDCKPTRVITNNSGDWGMEMQGAITTRIRFHTSAGGSGEVGSVTVSTTSTAYNTSSDYRLKENVVAMSGATERLKQLKPSRFNFIADADTTVDGFLAHEVQDIVPEAVTGTKDAMRDEEYEVTPSVLDDDGNVVTEAVMGTRSVPDYQGIDQSKLVPLLVATIQELEARIAALES